MARLTAASAWLAMTDACSHSVLRGRYALEHSYFVAPANLALPAEGAGQMLLLRQVLPRHRQAPLKVFLQ